MTRYTDEDDARIRNAFVLPFRSSERASALSRLSDDYGRTIEALRSRWKLLEERAGRPRPNRRNVLPFTDQEDADILGLGWRPTQAMWEDLSRRTNREISSLRHRRLKLRNKAKPPVVPRPDQEPRFRRQLPVATPAWFEHPITRDRLMAGR